MIISGARPAAPTWASRVEPTGTLIARAGLGGRLFFSTLIALGMPEGGLVRARAGARAVSLLRSGGRSRKIGANPV